MSDAFDAFATACSGAVAAVVAKSVSYPLDLMKTKLAVAEGNKGPRAVASELYHEQGIGGFYVGLGPKITKSVVQKFLFFYLYDFFMRRYKSMMGVKKLRVVANILIGVVADWFASPLVVPINFITTQVQTSTTGDTTLTVISRTLGERGCFAFFDGLDSYIAGSWQPAIEFTFFDQLKVVFLRGGRVGNTLSTLQAFCLGFAARAVSEVFTYPTERCALVQQSKDHPLRGKSTSQVLWQLFGDGGFAFLYQGISSPLVAHSLLTCPSCPSAHFFSSCDQESARNWRRA
jgi:hypothetical protein